MINYILLAAVIALVMAVIVLSFLCKKLRDCNKTLYTAYITEVENFYDNGLKGVIHVNLEDAKEETISFEFFDLEFIQSKDYATFKIEREHTDDNSNGDNM